MTPPTIGRKRDLVWISPGKIVPNDNNPRQAAAFTPDELVSLRRSIMSHGVLEPVIITPYKGDTYKLIEGERRWTSAKIEGIKEIPAIVVGRMDDHDELVVMFNVHTQRRGWEVAEQLNAIKRLMEANPDKADEEIAAALGVSVATFRDRRQVLSMGEGVVMQIARGEIDYYAALRTDQVSKTLARRRPALIEEIGGEETVRSRLLAKAKNRKGMTRELENIRQDAADLAAVPDEVLKTYIERPNATLSDARAEAKTLTERRAVEDLVKEIRHLSSDLRRFDFDLHETPNLHDLRRALATLIDVAQSVEEKIVAVSIEQASVA
jgi:ParB/RepB/Spo0J family partition protein